VGSKTQMGLLTMLQRVNKTQKARSPKSHVDLCHYEVHPASDWLWCSVIGLW
jgi:hypothetical protein